jgi:hypothetical protein
LHEERRGHSLRERSLISISSTFRISMLTMIVEYGHPLLNHSKVFPFPSYLSSFLSNFTDKMRLSHLQTLIAPIFSSTLVASHHANAGVLQYVNPKIGTYGITPNGNGGMIPSVSVPFGMTRWMPQTREKPISQCPYNDADQYIHGFQATHQPAIWMGESVQVVLSAGVG